MLCIDLLNGTACLQWPVARFVVFSVQNAKFRTVEFMHQIILVNNTKENWYLSSFIVLLTILIRVKTLLQG